MSEGSGLQRSQSFLIPATGLHRAGHLVLGVLAPAQHQRHSLLSRAGVTVALAVSVLLFATARSHGSVTAGPVLADLFLVGCFLSFVVCAGGARRPAEVARAMLLGGSASAASAVALPRLPAVAGAGAALLATHAAGNRLADADVAVAVAHLHAVLASAVLARVLRRCLRRQGNRPDAATATGTAIGTATGTEDGGGGVTVTAVDRGVGFGPEKVPQSLGLGQGLGLRHSVTARMNEAGGAASVDSAPGEGTRVALRWPA
ncbi:hypothetical protein [Streptomyces sp. bgisy022]|uniref:hypothetical protein n=1 Tax=Streptomyces sp. bgisy022 TaxID=3413769 RepID=UPI003D7522DB